MDYISVLFTVMLSKNKKQKPVINYNKVLLIWTSILLLLFTNASGSDSDVPSCHKLSSALENKKYADPIPSEPVGGKYFIILF